MTQVSQPALAAGTRLGPYEILAPIGAGGMGEVYRATDTRLHRVVAIKVIGRTHSHDPELRARFRVEAEAIAALTHPHICRLYDVGEHADVEFLVMEHLEGETLAARLTRGRLPLDEAIGYAIAIAGALDHAHRQGIVHRDVKPANVMLTRAGPKLLDFGLARLRAPSTAVVAGQSTVARAPGLTEPGDALGTWQYMAPEQVRGEHADARTDVFALGALIYEMLTGRRPFLGATHHDLVVAILEQQPPSLTSVDAAIPPALDRVVASCLAKDRADRWQSAGDVHRALDAMQSVDGTSAAVPRPLSWQPIVATAFAALILMVLAFAVGSRTSSAPRASKVIRSTMLLSPEQVAIGAGALAFAPDGQSFVYEGRVDGRSQLYRRTLESERGEPIAGTEAGRSPFFSPDGEWLGFSLPDRLMKVPAGGGRPVEITNAAAAYGASWGADDTIVFSPRAQTGLLRVPASGGTPTTLTTLAAEDEGNDHRYPQVLPGAGDIIFTVGTGPEDAARIVALDLQTGTRTELVRGSASGRYVPSGYLVYAREAQLFAMPFDADRLAVTGAPVRLVSGVAESTDGAPEYAFSPEGDLVYVPGTSGGPQNDVVLVDMKGAVEPTAIPTGVWPGVSPDGRRIAVTVGGAKNNVWIYDRDRKTSTRVTFGRYHWPVWMSDGRLTLAQGGPGDLSIVRRSSDGGGPDEELVPATGRAQYPETWTPDGRTLFYRRSDRGQWDLWKVSPGVSPPEPFLATPFNERYSKVSPDGKWLAYASNENGRSEIYVRSLHGDRVQREQVSVNGAAFAVWAPDSRRMYYRGTIPDAAAAGVWTAVIDATTLRVSPPRLLFSQPGFDSFDITPDGTRFVMTTVDNTPPPQQINLVLNSLGILAQSRARD